MIFFEYRLRCSAYALIPGPEVYVREQRTTDKAEEKIKPQGDLRIFSPGQRKIFLTALSPVCTDKK
jgi:hypothetical protein